MAVGLGAGGIVGLAFETLAAPGTYVAPTKYVPVESETLTFGQEITKRRPIQGVVDPVGSKLGNGSVSGDIMFACYYDVLPWFLYAMRTSVAKTGIADPWTYDVDGSHGAEGAYSLSITVERNGVPFGFVGCYVSSLAFSITDGILICTASIVGFDEASQASPVAAYTSTGKEFSAGQYVVEYADVVVATVDELEITIDDAADPQFRLAGTTGADLIVFGERTTTISLSRDFEDRTEYNLFRATTPQKFEFIATSGTHSVAIEVPVAVVGTYEVGLSGQGELVRASIEYEGDYDATRDAGYNITVITDEDITVPVV